MCDIPAELFPARVSLVSDIWIWAGDGKIAILFLQFTDMDRMTRIVRTFTALTLIRMTKDEKVLAFFKGLLL